MKNDLKRKTPTTLIVKVMRVLLPTSFTIKLMKIFTYIISVSYPNNRVKFFISGNLLKIKKPAPAKNTGSKTNVL